MFGYVFYRQFNYKMVTHARVFSLKFNHQITDRQGMFISNSLKFLYKLHGYENMCTWDKIKNLNMKLPKNEYGIDYDFMESFIKEVELLHVKELEFLQTKQLKSYLAVSELKDYSLTKEEQDIIDNFNSIYWKNFNLKTLFGKSDRGKRLKSGDRLKGALPFVTAGEINEGISDFIGNSVKIFEKNTVTIDMFGSAKYRNYQYGGDDHISVVHTEKLDKNSAIFVTCSIHKSSHNGQFSYGKNFYPKDADELNIQLPCVNNEPDYDTMKLIISAIHKLVIKDIILSSSKKIDMTRQILNIQQ